MLEHSTVAHLIQAGFLASFLDGTTSGLIFFVALIATAAISTWRVAKSKGRSVFCWVTLALMMPLIPLVLVWLLPSLTTYVSRPPQRRYENRQI